MRLPRVPAVRWPTLLLLTSLGFTALGLVEAWRAVRSQRRVAEHALRDYAGFAAWSYAQHVRDAIGRATSEALGAVNHGEGRHTSPRVPDAHDLAHYLPFDPRCGCHRPEFGSTPAIYFGWKLGTDTLAVGVNTHPDPERGWELDRPMPSEVIAHPPRARDGVVPARLVDYTPAERRWVNDTITRQVRAAGRLGNFPLVLATHDDTPRLLVYTVMPTSWGDTLIYGAEYPRAALAALLRDVMNDRALLPAAFARGKSPRELLRLQVTDATGATLFESSPGRWTLDDTTRLDATFGALRVRAEIRPELAGTLVIGGLPRSRLPFLLGLLAVSTALALVALGQIRRAGELARMRGAFVDSVSHELRTPLAQMRVYLETLRLGRFTTDEQRAAAIGNVERETTRLSHLVERVLRFSGVGRALVDGEPRPAVDVGAEVERVVAEFRPLAAARRMRVDVTREPTAAVRLQDAALRHVLLNLLDNAVKYGPTGQAVRVRVWGAPGEVRVSVADDGPGVPAADRAAIWRPYERGSTAGHTSGSGIGLAIVRDVAALHGGRAWVESPHGGGAEFVVAFPAEPGAPARVPNVVAAAAR